MSLSTVGAMDSILQWNKEGGRGRFHQALDMFSIQSQQEFNTSSLVKSFLLLQDPGGAGFSPVQPA